MCVLLNLMCWEGGITCNILFFIAAFSDGVGVTYNADDELVTFSFPEELKVCSDNTFECSCCLIISLCAPKYIITVCTECIHSQVCIQTGNAVLKVVFTGVLNDKMKGFYRSKYKGADGQERFGAVTQFEVTL